MKIKNGFVLEKVGGAYIAVAVGDRTNTFNGVVRLNGTGAFIWNLLVEREYTREEIVEKIVEAYEGVSADDVTDGVRAFEEKLRAAGIIEE